MKIGMIKVAGIKVKLEAQENLAKTSKNQKYYLEILKQGK